MCAFLSERRGARQFRVEPRVDFGKGMNNRLFQIMVNDPNGRDSTGSVFVNKLLGRFLQAFSPKERNGKGDSCRG